MEKRDTLHTKSALIFFFLFVIPITLASYLIFMLLSQKAAAFSAAYIGIVVFCVILSGAFGGFVLKKIITSITGLTKDIKLTSGGAETFGGNELKDLAMAFNRITRDLESKIKDLESSHSLTRELFQKIGYAITSTHKTDALFKLIVQTMKKVLIAEGSFLALYDSEMKHLLLRAYSGPQKDISENMELPSDKGVVSFAITASKPMVIKKGGSKEMNIPPEEEYLSYNNMLCVPIMEKSVVIGVLGVSNLKDTGKIDTEDLFLLENLAGQLAIAIENLKLSRDLEKTYYETLLTLARAVEAKDAYSAGHLERVGRYVMKLADRLNINEETKKVLKGGAVLHDLGKLGIRDEILKKEGKFTPEEYEIMKHHSVIGENILKPLRSMSKLSELVRHHHESYDGTGYPDGLKGEEIPLTSRMLSIADMYDAITTDRPYRKAMTAPEAIKTMRSFAGTKMDPKLTEIFISILRDVGKRQKETKEKIK
ncbi:MAG: HD domain-containing protein [Candidatus Omnitrophica bacterium]|nr:HD domain-containing protein [Candidatus Omnitrophota bacterium]